MSRPTLCGACRNGQHENHRRDWNVMPGVLGGDVCPCTGGCTPGPVQIPGWADTTIPPAARSDQDLLADYDPVPGLVARGVMADPADGGEDEEGSGGR